MSTLGDLIKRDKIVNAQAATIAVQEAEIASLKQILIACDEYLESESYLNMGTETLSPIEIKIAGLQARIREALK